MGTAFDLHGPKEAPLANVLLKDIVIKSAKASLVIENVAELHFDNVMIGEQQIDGTINWKQGDAEATGN